MKPRFNAPDGGAHDSDAIRSEIARTREKMDHTLDEISERMTPRHLLDEVLDFFRSHKPEPGKVKEKTSAAMSRAGDKASDISHAIADVVRQHPVPTLLIGAGIAWAFYEKKKQSEPEYSLVDEEEQFGAGGYEGYEPGATAVMGEEEHGKFPGAKEKLSSGMESAKEGLHSAREKLQGKAQELRERASEKGRMARVKASQLKQRVSESAHRGYEVSRDKFVETSEAHPLSTGLGFLAIGLLAGLVLPSTRKEDEWIGRASDRVKEQAKERSREMIERGKNVAQAAVGAAKEEAREQGLTPGALKEKARQVAQEAKGAAQQTAHEERSEMQGAGAGSGSSSSNPPPYQG